jgi:hypothetical protein
MRKDDIPLSHFLFLIPYFSVPLLLNFSQLRQHSPEIFR